MNIKVFALSCLIILAGPVGRLWTESIFPSPALQKVKTAPKKYSEAADVVTEWTEAAEECEPEKICVEGLLHNRGKKTAYGVKLLVAVGGGKHAKPRTSFYKKLENPIMNPEDRQEFSFTIDRKIPYKDNKGKSKEVEVGKYNFKITPVWSNK